MPDERRRCLWQMAQRLCRPDVEHFLFLILLSLLSILGFVFWTYEDDQSTIRWSNQRQQQLDIYESAIDGFLRDERRLMEERDAMFPEFPGSEGDVPDVLMRHRDSVSRAPEVPSEKSDGVLDEINRDFRVQKRRMRRKKGRRRRRKNPKERNSTNGRLDPLNGGEAFCKIYNTKPDVDEDFECIRIDFKPSVQVCLYPTSMDVHISHHLRTAGIWEPHILRHFQNILFQDPNLGVYDIGANIGQYALVAAAMGRRVVAVEPHLPSLRRLHKAIKLGKLENKIILLQNAVSDRRDTLELSIPDDNQGGVALTSQDADRFCAQPDCPPHATTIVMDDLLEVTNFDRAVVKVDIEGHEHRAFVRSQDLFRTVDVRFIIMEWIKLRGYYGSDADDTPDKRLVFELIDYLVEMGYTPKGSLLLNKLDPRYWYGWPDDIFWEAPERPRKGDVTPGGSTADGVARSSEADVGLGNREADVYDGNHTPDMARNSTGKDFHRILTGYSDPLA